MALRDEQRPAAGYLLAGWRSYPMSLRTARAWAVLLLLVGAGVAGVACGGAKAKKAAALKRGDAYFAEGKYREAVVEYLNVLQVARRNLQAIRNLGIAYHELKDYGVAFPYLSEAVKREPDRSDLRIRLATILLIGKQHAEAREQLTCVLDTDPLRLDALVLLADAVRSPEEVDDAMARFEQARGDHQGRADFLVRLGSLHMKKGETADAERLFRQAVAAEPDAAEPHVALALFHAGGRDLAAAEQEFKAAAAVAGYESEAPIVLAQFYLAGNRVEEAKRILTDVVAKTSDSVAAWRLLGSIAFDQGALEESEKAVAMTLRFAPYDMGALIIQGELQLARKRTAEAIETFQGILKANAKYAPALFHLGRAYLQAGNLNDARTALAAATAVAPNYDEAVVLQASLHNQAGEYDQAIRDLERVISRSPRIAQAYDLIGLAYLGKKDPDQAEPWLRKLRALDPQNPRAALLLGVALRGQGKVQEAVSQLEAALAIDSAYLDPLDQLARIEFDAHRPAAAVERVERQIGLLSAPSARHQLLLGDVQQRAGHNEQAEAAYARAIELDPRLTDGYARLAKLYAATGRYDEAIAKYAKLSEADPKDPRPLMIIGHLREKMGNPAEAARAYEKLLEMDPQFAPAANNAACIYALQPGGEEKAWQLAQRAHDLAPHDPYVADTYGWLLFRRGELQPALMSLLDSAAKLPDSPDVQYHLGMIYHRLGQEAEARKALGKALELSPSFSGVEEARRILEQME
jgi:putative PEP-CTERM system TPR-repeat lipoprotein